MGSLYKRTWKDKKGKVHESNVWWIKYYQSGKPYRESSGSTKESDAKRLLRLREGDIAKGVPVTPRVGRIRFDELLQAVVDDYKVNERSTIKDVEMRIRRHLTPFFGGRRAASITTADIRKFTVKRKEEGATNAEINRELAVLKRAFNLGCQDGKLITKPYAPMMAENNVRKGFFELDQFKAVRKYLPDFLKPLVTFAYITGWRIRSEVQTLQWPQVDFAACRVYLEPGTTKNDDARWFPFTQELEAVLLEQQRRTDELRREKGVICPFVFHRDGKPIKNFYKAWRTACKKAGVPGRIPHDFRRTAVRNMDRAGITENIAMKLTGHKTPSVYHRYNIVSDRDLEEAARRLDAVSGTVSGTVGV